MERTRLTLLQLTGMIGNAINQSFPDAYWLIAEINEIRENHSGHCYIELVEKETDGDNIVARSRATIWAYTWRMLKPYFETSTSQSLSRGMKILVEVSVEFHELYGLSLNIKDIDPVYTLGDIERRRAEIIRQLEDEGIFNMNKALKLPVPPSRIAVISSLNAAGYEDFTHQIVNNSQKYLINLTLFPALMQGSNAGRSVTDALDAVFEREGMFDIVVILRGGGAASDLNCFNSYELAAHIAQFPLPVITGIGHERDRTISGMVAHTDLKTPTAVAEFLIDRFQEADNTIIHLSKRLTTGVSLILRQNRQTLDAAFNFIPLVISNNLKNKDNHLKSTGSILVRSATNYIQQKKYQVISNHTHFGFIIKNYLLRLKNRNIDLSTTLFPGRTGEFIRRRKERLNLHETAVGLADPGNILKKGFALVMKDGKIVKNAADVVADDVLETKLHDGRITSKVLNTNIKSNQ